MDRKKELGIIGGLIGLGAVIIVVTVAWAAFSTTLNINGSATVAKSSWNIQFQNLSAIQEGNDNGVTEGVIEGTTPTITGSTTIGTYAVTLTKPGDYAIYDFEIANTGTFDAQIDQGFTIPTPTCTAGANSTNANDATNVCSKISYTLNYITVNEGTTTVGAAVQAGDTLNANETKKVRLKLYFDKTMATANLPTDNVTVSNLGITITYNQV